MSALASEFEPGEAIRRRLAGASVGAISLESAFGRLHPQLHKLALIPHGIQSGD